MTAPTKPNIKYDIGTDPTGDFRGKDFASYQRSGHKGGYVETVERTGPKTSDRILTDILRIPVVEGVERPTVRYYGPGFVDNIGSRATRPSDMVR